MPNHVTNVLEISADGDDELIERILKEIKGEKEYIDFAAIVPEPDNLFKDNLGSEDRKRCAEEGIPNWYDWNCDNWGTKWNAYDQSYEDLGYGCHQLTFDTAWSPPLPVIEALRTKYPDAYIAGHWVEEGHQSAGVF